MPNSMTPEPAFAAAPGAPPTGLLSCSFTPSACRLARRARVVIARRTPRATAAAPVAPRAGPGDTEDGAAEEGVVEDIDEDEDGNVEGVMEEDETHSLLQSMRILRRTDHWVAVSKPAGVLVHRTRLYASRRGETYVRTAVRRALKSATNPHPDVHPVHRLDRPTTGVLLFAIGDSRTAALLQQALQAPDSSKQYWVLAGNASGMPSEGAWVNDHPLKDLVSGRKNRKQRPAHTSFQRLAAFDEGGDVDVAVLRASLSTGRRHQIRRHLAYGRFPVVGDTSHGDTARNHFWRDTCSVPRLCLHARRLSFTDPFDGSRVDLESPVPDDLRQVVERLPGYTAAMNGDLDLGDELGDDWFESTT